MSIEIHCQNCDKRYRVKADLAGKRVRCSNCGNPVTVPNGQDNQGGNQGDGDAGFAADPAFEAPPQPKRGSPAPPKAAPPPVPRQVVRFDPRFEPEASDIPAPPPPAAPTPKTPQRTPQTARKAPPEAAREIRFADDDPLFMAKPKVSNHDNLADTADGPAIGADAPEPKLDEEPLIPRGKRKASKMASTAAGRAPDEPDLDIAPPTMLRCFRLPRKIPR